MVPYKPIVIYEVWDVDKIHFPGPHGGDFGLNGQDAIIYPEYFAKVSENGCSEED